jgi:hypothetical protein
MSITVRKVAWHDTLGVFLGFRHGQPVWSKVTTASQGPKGGELAPTFLDLDDFRAYLKAELGPEGQDVKEQVESIAAGVRVREFVRTLGAPYEGASSAECVEAGMTGW